MPPWFTPWKSPAWLAARDTANKRHKCALSMCKNLENWRWITLTFGPKFHAQTAKTLFYKTVGWIYKKLWRIAKHNFSFVPELTGMGVLHYHILIYTREYVRLASFINCWKARYGLVDGNPDNVHCILYLKHHYMRKQNAEMAKLLHWPRMTMVISGLIPNIFFSRLSKELGRRNALKRDNDLQQYKLKYIDLTTI